MKRQEHLAEVEEVAIRVRVENLKNGRYLGTSPDVPGLVAEGRSVAETVEIAQGLARKIVESCWEHGDPLPPAFRSKVRSKRVIETAADFFKKRAGKAKGDGLMKFLRNVPRVAPEPEDQLR
jgi:predicted RNase H-like HicB family nuclease